LVVLSVVTAVVLNNAQGELTPLEIGLHELGDYPNELLELAIAHAVGDKVEAAYRRGNMLAKRHQLMADWERFCGGAGDKTGS
jgi:hypothetical protein